MKPGVSHRDTTGRPNASHSCRNRAALSAASASIAPPRWLRVVGDHAERPALDPDERGDHAGAEARAQLQHGVGVGQRVDRRRARRRRAAGSPAPACRSSAWSAQVHSCDASLEVATGTAWPPRPPPPRRPRARRPRRWRLLHARPARSPPGRTRPARRPRSSPVRPCRCSRPSVAMMTSQQPSSAALPAKHRPDTMPTSGTRPDSRPKVWNVGTSRPDTVAESVSPGRPPPPSANSTTGSRCRSASSSMRSVLRWLLHALRAGQHRVVVGQTTQPAVAPTRRVDGGQPGDHPVGRGAVDQLLDACAAGAAPRAPARRTRRSCPGRTGRRRSRAPCAGRSRAPARDRRRAAPRRARSRAAASTSARSALTSPSPQWRYVRNEAATVDGSSDSRLSPSDTRSPTAIPPAGHAPAAGAMTAWCIFIASMTTSSWPSPTRSPSTTEISTTVPVSGAVTGITTAAPARAPAAWGHAVAERPAADRAPQPWHRVLAHPDQVGPQLLTRGSDGPGQRDAPRVVEPGQSSPWARAWATLRARRCCRAVDRRSTSEGRSPRCRRPYRPS